MVSISISSLPAFYDLGRLPIRVEGGTVAVVTTVERKFRLSQTTQTERKNLREVKRTDDFSTGSPSLVVASSANTA